MFFQQIIILDCREVNTYDLPKIMSENFLAQT